MEYISTRGKEKVNSSQAVLQGIASDGGLFINTDFPKLDLDKVLRMTSFEMSEAILSAVLPDIEGMKELVYKAYSSKFDTDDLTPLVKVGDDFVLELFHGPTSAFKDVALCMLPQLMSAAKKQNGIEEKITILVATSGDTGKAALEGFAGTDGIDIEVFYPYKGVSKVQELQMTTQEGDNTRVCAVKGNFDDCQTAVKTAFAKLAGKEGIRLSSANSINIGRLAPQIVYYFIAYKKLVEDGEIKSGDKVDYIVPTGNFGDILAGYYAKQMGLPVGKLVCASNRNKVLTDFFETGVYDKRRDFYKTTSPSMDILVSSNLERLLYINLGSEKTADCMAKLSSEGFYKLDDAVMSKIRKDFGAGYADEKACGEAIAETFKKYGYVMDPHTATAAAVRKNFKSENKCVILSTASPYKFPKAVLEALGENIYGDEFDLMKKLEAISGTKAPKNLSGLKEKTVRHSDVIDKDNIIEYVEKTCRN